MLPPPPPPVAYCPGHVASWFLPVEGRASRQQHSLWLCSDPTLRVLPLESGHGCSAVPLSPSLSAAGLDETPATIPVDGGQAPSHLPLSHACTRPATVETQVTLLNSAFSMCLLLQALGILPDPGLPPALTRSHLSWSAERLSGEPPLWGTGSSGPCPALLISVPCLAL